MLKFFEYLRQRAFESVLAGAQEALECLESQGFFDKPATRTKSERATIESEAVTTGSAAENLLPGQPGDPHAQTAANNVRAQQPRLRRRPKRRGSRQ